MVSIRVAAGALLSAAVLSISSSLLFSQILPQVIYGEDDRRDLYQLEASRWQEFARSTALLIDRIHVRKLEDKEYDYQLVTKKAGKRYRLCRREAFWEQPSTGACSGFLVGEDVLVSAGHCFLDVGACKATAVVFDYSYHSSDTDPTRLSSSSVYFCKEVLERVYEIAEGLDFAVVRLDRAVQGRKALSLRTQGKVAKGEELTIIGHPLGLPTKVSYGKARSVRKHDYFVINADLWTGNSGSPVFDSHTGIVNGLVASGEEDFIYDSSDDCQVSKVCAPDACDGERVIRARLFVDYVIPHL